jgi:tetratricopeptide (TPR) repeat protein
MISPGLLAALLAAAACVMTPPRATGQEPPPPLQPGQFDPSDVYFQGYLAARAGEQLEADGDFIGSWEKFEQAAKLFESVRKFYPDWKPAMVEGRTARTHEALENIRPKAVEQRDNKQNVVAELEGGVRAPGRIIDPARDVAPLTPGILEVDPVATRRLAEAEAEVARLRKLIQDAKAGEAEAARNASRTRDIERQRNELQARLKAEETNAKSLRERLAASPMKSEMESLNQRIEGLEQEREAMAKALTQSRGAHTEALSRIATLEADLNVMRGQVAEMRQKEADLARDMKHEREVANSVVTGQRRQLAELERTLAERNGELLKANEQIASLSRQLQESHDAFAQLRDERDALLVERDQMAALLKLNEAGRINDLIEQNMGLAKQLREANEKVDRLNLDNNAAKDDIIDALRDLAIAKSQINRLQQEKRDQDKRLAELEEKLRREEASLAQGQASADPAEVELLRDIIKRQLRVQERRRQARDLLVEAARELGANDEKLAQAIELFDGQEVVLSPDEQRLIADKQVDGEFVSPFARDRTTVNRATADLHREIEGFDRAATKAFLAGRLLPTRELYEMIIDQHPGHTPALCKLGVVHLRLDDPPAAADVFRRAVELDGGNAYAYRMLGFSMMAMGDLEAAAENVRHSVELAPNDAKSQTLLAEIRYRQGKTGEAESHYKAAITADPMPSEPYFNLAMLCANSKRMELARDYYNQALERGAAPDPALEKRLYQQP